MLLLLVLSLMFCDAQGAMHSQGLPQDIGKLKLAERALRDICTVGIIARLTIEIVVCNMISMV